MTYCEKISGKEVSLPRSLILVIFTPLKALISIVSRLGRTKSFIARLVQLLNAYALIAVSEEGKFIFVREEHPSKHALPMVVRVSGK